MAQARSGGFRRPRLLETAHKARKPAGRPDGEHSWERDKGHSIGADRAAVPFGARRSQSVISLEGTFVLVIEMKLALEAPARLIPMDDSDEGTPRGILIVAARNQPLDD